MNENKALGRNQKIAAVGFGIPLMLTFALCGVLSVTEGVAVVLPQWISFCQIYVPIAMGTILGVSGALKAVETVKGSKS